MSVLKELLSNGRSKNCFLGLATNIAATLEIEKTKPAEMLDMLINTEDLRTDNDKVVSADYKEAMLVALAALEAGIKNEQ